MTLGAALHDLPATVWGVNVCDDEQYFLDKVTSDAADWAAKVRDETNAEPIVIEPGEKIEL